MVPSRREAGRYNPIDAPLGGETPGKGLAEGLGDAEGEGLVASSAAVGPGWPPGGTDGEFFTAKSTMGHPVRVKRPIRQRAKPAK
jgi:hypothetical protein